jgi:hypothetical protein
VLLRRLDDFDRSGKQLVLETKMQLGIPVVIHTEFFRVATACESAENLQFSFTVTEADQVSHSLDYKQEIVVPVELQ